MKETHELNQTLQQIQNPNFNTDYVMIKLIYKYAQPGEAFVHTTVLVRTGKNTPLCKMIYSSNAQLLII